MKANSKDLRANTEESLMVSLESFNDGLITFEQCATNIKKLVESSLSVMFHIGYERGAEDLKETIFKPEV